MRLVLLLIGTAVLTAVGVHLSVTSGPVDPINGYRSWTRVMKEPVYMAPQVSMLCASVPVLRSPNPHVPKKFLVYLNPLAANAQKNKATYPEGAVIVKEKYDASDKANLKHLAKPELLTVMVKKKKGSSPATGDWEFYAADGHGKRIQAPVKHCVSCHDVPQGGVFGGYGSLPFAKIKKGKSLYDRS